MGRSGEILALMAGLPARRNGLGFHDGEWLGKDLVCPQEVRRFREPHPATLKEIES